MNLTAVQEFALDSLGLTDADVVISASDDKGYTARSDKAFEEIFGHHISWKPICVLDKGAQVSKRVGLVSVGLAAKITNLAYMDTSMSTNTMAIFLVKKTSHLKNLYLVRAVSISQRNERYL